MSYQDLETGYSLPPGKDLSHGKQDASQAVAKGLFEIHTSVSIFKRLVNTLGTPKDTRELREKLHKRRELIGRMVKETSEKLRAARETDHVMEVSTSKKVLDAKLAKDFQALLKEFQKAQQIAAERETAYTPFVPQSVLSSRSDDNESNSYNQEGRALLAGQRQKVHLLENEIDFNEAIMEERQQGIQEIQQQIGEVNDIFKDLAVLVCEQGVMIDNIDSSIDSSHAETIQANSELSKAAKSQKSNSSLVCLILVIFVTVLLIVIIVLAT